MGPRDQTLQGSRRRFLVTSPKPPRHYFNAITFPRIYALRFTCRHATLSFRDQDFHSIPKSLHSCITIVFRCISHHVHSAHSIVKFHLWGKHGVQSSGGGLKEKRASGRGWDGILKWRLTGHNRCVHCTYDASSVIPFFGSITCAYFHWEEEYLPGRDHSWGKAGPMMNQKPSFFNTPSSSISARRRRFRNGVNF